MTFHPNAGYPLHLVIVSNNGDYNFDNIHKNNKRVILINNGIHPGAGAHHLLEVGHVHRHRFVRLAERLRERRAGRLWLALGGDLGDGAQVGESQPVGRRQHARRRRRQRPAGAEDDHVTNGARGDALAWPDQQEVAGLLRLARGRCRLIRSLVAGEVMSRTGR